MGKFASSPTRADCKNPNALQEFQATDLHVHGARTALRAHPWLAGLLERTRRGARLRLGREQPPEGVHLRTGEVRRRSTHPKKSTFRPPDGMPGGMLARLGNGTKAGTGILWAVVPLDGDANQLRGVPGHRAGARRPGRDAPALDERAGRRRAIGSGSSRSSLLRPWPAARSSSPRTATGRRRAKYGGNSRPTQFPARYYVAVYGLLPEAPHAASWS